MAYTYKWPRALVTVDAIPFSIRDGKLKVLLIRRGHAPWKGCWAMAGGFIEMDEKLQASARRELREETGLKPLWMEQFRAYGDPGRDSRGRAVTVAFFAAISPTARPRASSDAAEVGWHDFASPPDMACDHEMILREAYEELGRRVKCGGGLPAALQRKLARVFTAKAGRRRTS
jgi:8-oxo-dGTP diphosphatase